MFKTKAMVHSTESVQEITVLEKTGNNNYTVKTQSGVLCTAIFNPFTGLYYADDIYGVISDCSDNDLNTGKESD